MQIPQHQGKEMSVRTMTDGKQTLQVTRGLLDQSHYQQIPQLSTGVEMDLNQPLLF